MDQAISLEQIASSVRTPVDRYTELLKEMWGDHALALTLFGSVTASSFDAARDTVRSTLVVDRIDLATLRKLALHGAQMGKLAITAPLVMTPGYIKDSLDTFPLELLDIAQHHINVFGDDYFNDLTFEDTHVRLQCERELKTVLIGLRQGLLAAAGRDKFLAALQMDMGTGLMRTLRGMLWLKGSKEAKSRSDVFAEVEKIAERKLSGVRTALDPSAQHGWDEFESLYHDIEALQEIVNAW